LNIQRFLLMSVRVCLRSVHAKLWPVIGRQGGLLAAAARFVEDHGGPDDSPAGRRELPRRVQRLIELADQGRQQPDRYGYLDDAYPDDEFAEGVFGLIVLRDLRD
jgi:hypothetical protein